MNKGFREILDMKINNYGKVSIIMTAISYSIGIFFTALTWWTVALDYKKHKIGDPTPENFIVYIVSYIALLALPSSILAIVFSVIALIKGDSKIMAIISIFLSMPLLLFIGRGFWVAIMHGGV